MATCCAAIFTLGFHPILKWVWTAEETYARGDPRRILVNVHTERFKKVALLVGGAFAIAEAASLASLIPSRRIDVLVDSSGARCSLLDSLGFSQQVCLRSARARASSNACEVACMDEAGTASAHAAAANSH